MSEQDLTLSVTRLIDAPVEKVWKIAVERQAEWWCPKPWAVELIEQDWRAGGRSAMIMRGPEGEEMPSSTRRWASKAAGARSSNSPQSWLRGWLSD